MFVYSTVITGIQRQKKNSIKNKQWDKKRSKPALHQHMAAQILQLFIKGKTRDIYHDHTAGETASVTAAIVRNVLKRTF